MPHSLYLGTDIVQPRLYSYDLKHDLIPSSASSSLPEKAEEYRPSLAAIKHCLSYSIAEIVVNLLTFALFVNSAILIVAGASLSGVGSAGDADIFGIHDLLSSQLSSAAGTIFALALLMSGTSA